MHGTRQDAPPKMIRIDYEIIVDRTETDQRLDLLHRTLRKYGTLSNTLAEATERVGPIRRKRRLHAPDHQHGTMPSADLVRPSDGQWDCTRPMGSPRRWPGYAPVRSRCVLTQPMAAGSPYHVRRHAPSGTNGLCACAARATAFSSNRTPDHDSWLHILVPAFG